MHPKKQWRTDDLRMELTAQDSDDKFVNAFYRALLERGYRGERTDAREERLAKLHELYGPRTWNERFFGRNNERLFGSRP